MSDFWNRVAGIKQQQNALELAKQDASIAKASDFWNRVEGIKTLETERNGAVNEFRNATGNNPDVPVPVTMVSGNDPNNDVPKFTQTAASGHSYGGSSAVSVGSSSVKPATIDYLNADLAKHYGLSKNTAYQEALENTAYQRAMTDMKAAGLNPAVMFGTGRADGAGTNVYPSSPSSGRSGGGGGYSRRYGSSGNGKLFSSSTYGALAAIGGLVGIAATGRPDGFWIGSQVSQGAMNLLNAFHNR